MALAQSVLQGRAEQLIKKTTVEMRFSVVVFFCKLSQK